MGHGSETRIIPLNKYRDKMSATVFSQVEAYWQALRDGDKPPLRAAIDPRGIEDALEYAIILERIAPGLARFRLAGKHLVDLMGMEVRGMPFSALFMGESRRDIGTTLETVFDGPGICSMTLSSDRGLTKPALSARLLLLPLRSDFGDCTRALGCLVSEGKIGRAPRRFRLVNSESRPLATAGKTQLPPRMTEATVPGFAETGPEFSLKPYLKLVHSTD